MKSKFLCAAVAVAGVFASSVALAQGPYFLGSVGWSLSSSKMHKDAVSGFTAEGGSVNSTSKTKSSVGFKAILGYQYNDNFALEGGYYYLGRYKCGANASMPDDEGGTTQVNMDFSSTTHLIGLDAVGFIPFNKSVSAFGKVGVGLAFAKTKSNDLFSYDDGVVRKDSESKTKVSFVPKFGAGLEWNCSKQVAMRVEYEYFLKTWKYEGYKNNNHLISLGVRVNY